MSIIYKTTNLINGKIYVGQHFTSADDGYLGSGIYIKRALKKYGKENFIRETIEYCTSANIDEQEIYWINELSAINFNIGYNINVGGNGVGSGPNHPLYGKHPSKETILKVSKSNIGKKRTDAFKIKQKERFSGNKNPMFGITGKDHPNFNKHLSLETKLKISNSNKGKAPPNKGIPMIEEQKRKISKTNRDGRFLGENNPNQKYNYIVSNGENYWNFFTKEEKNIISGIFRRKKSNIIKYKLLLIERKLKNG